MKPQDITAWALNELSPEEREQLEAELLATPEARQKARKTQDFCSLLSQHLVNEDAAFSPEQRERLQALPLTAPIEEEAPRMNGRAFHAKVTAARERAEPKSSLWMRFAALAACLMLAMFVVNQSRQLPSPQLAVKSTAPDMGSVSMTLEKPVTDLRRNTSAVPAPVPPASPMPILAMKSPPAAPDSGELAKRLTETAANPPAEPKSLAWNEEKRFSGSIEGKGTAPASPVLQSSIAANPVPSDPAPSGGLALTKAGAGTLGLSGANTYTGGVTINAGTLRLAPAAPIAENPAALGDISMGGAIAKSAPGSTTTLSTGVDTITGSGGVTITSGATLNLDSSANSLAYQPQVTTKSGRLGEPSTKDLNGFVQSVNEPTNITISGTMSGTTRSATAPAAGSTLTLNSDVADPQGNAYAGRINTRAWNINSADKTKEAESRLDELRVQRADAFAKPGVAGTARYSRIVENPFQTVTSQPLSTFSIDVDTASYANVRRFLNAGSLPPPDAVRLEELINYFPYDYEQPGKEQPFSVHVDVAEAPWAPQHRLARVSIKGRDVGQERPAANFTFLVDVSGSMDSPERLPLVKQSLEMLTEQLRDDDHVAIVTYAGACRVALESTQATEKGKILQVIRGLHAGGSTNGESGIILAYQQSAEHFIKDGINRVILCTDGDFNVGISNPHELEKLIKEKAKGGTFLSVLGFGTDNLQDRTMMVLADHGNGNYAYIDSLGEARKVLVEQMRGTLITIAKDVKIQVEFNPAVVASYRLVGYEKRLLAAKDFNNDKKDAGEIGSGHTITAFYELVPTGLAQPNGALAEVEPLKYQPQNKDKPATLPSLGAKAPERKMEGINDETMTVKLRYKEPDGQISKLIEVPVHDAKSSLKDSPRDFRFAAAVAGFGMLLRDSEQVENFGFESVRKLALSGKGEDALGYRGEFIQLIDKAKGLKGR